MREPILRVTTPLGPVPATPATFISDISRRADDSAVPLCVRFDITRNGRGLLSRTLVFSLDYVTHKVDIAEVVL